MPEPQPIETAPRDGTPILTDEGIALCYGSRWHACTTGGNGFINPFGGHYFLEPKLWQPLPDWMRK